MKTWLSKRSISNWVLCVAIFGFLAAVGLNTAMVVLNDKLISLCETQQGIIHQYEDMFLPKKLVSR